MTDQFKIDMDRMRTVSKQLDECAKRMKTVAKSLENAGIARQAGNAWLDSACLGFERHWHGAMGRMGKLAHNLHEGLDESLKAYTDNEQGVAKAYSAAGSRD
ncbi:hypothetical protein [Kitasatospora sp. NPDC056273]|uniref:hypothetical protein n=1 Tax=Kitasatospora sp. NPDC056273 TaxID=3345769 RepID=UPI0035DBEB94